MLIWIFIAYIHHDHIQLNCEELVKVRHVILFTFIYNNTQRNNMQRTHSQTYERSLKNKVLIGVIFDNNLRWNLHSHNIVGKLRAITYKFNKLKNLIQKKTIRIIYFALYQSIYQYGILVWGGLGDGVLRQLQVNKNNIVRICLNKCTLEGSTRQNYLDLDILPILSLYKKKCYYIYF